MPRSHRFGGRAEKRWRPSSGPLSTRPLSSRLWASGAALALVAGGVAIASPAVAVGSTATASRMSTALDLQQCPWMDTSKSPSERAQLLLDASTLHQKYRWLDEKAANAPQQTEFSGVTYPMQVPCTPTVVYTDGPEGVRGVDGVTAFPTELSVASTWDTDLSYDKGTAQGAEAFDKGKNGFLAPGLSSSRTPLAGRTSEYLGEDPLLAGTLGAAQTRGMQTGTPDKPVMSVIKHYVANEQETDRQTSSSNMDERTLHEVYDLPFGVLMGKSDPAGVMCSFNQVNGIYACENPILKNDLKAELGFDGYVVSDFGSVHSTAPSLMAGLDQELNRPKYFTPDALDAAIAAGEITEADVDAAAKRVITAYIKTGLFDHPMAETPVTDASPPAHTEIAKTIAEEGSVLLKNDGVLPLAGDGSTIALIGPTVSATPNADGVSAASVCSLPGFRGGTTMNCEDLVSPEEGITERAAAAGDTVVVDDGSDPAVAAQKAAEADVAIVFGRISQGEFSDIPNLHLQDDGDALIDAVAASAKKTIVVVETGSAVVMPWLDKVDGVIEAWYPGEQQGPALASLLWGDTNFSGKLPMTFPKSIADTPTNSPAQYPGIKASDDAIRQVDYSEGLQVGYKWYDAQGIDPLFEFGYGLSYTQFAYSGLSLDRDATTGTTTVTFTVQNTGDVAGTAIPQIYFTLPESAGEPGKRLVGFDRVTLDPGASTTVTVDVDPAAPLHPYAIWDVDADQWTNVSGAYTVNVGSSSRMLPLSQSMDVDFAASVPTTPTAPTGGTEGAEGPQLAATGSTTGFASIAIAMLMLAAGAALTIARRRRAAR